MYTPSNQPFKAFPVSKINSETSFLYQLFMENSNFIVSHARFFITHFFFYYFLYFGIYLGMYTPSNHHFKAFLVSEINSKTKFLCQHFKKEPKFTVLNMQVAIVLIILVLF